MDPMTHLLLHRQREHEAAVAAERHRLLRAVRRRRGDDRLPDPQPTVTPAPRRRVAGAQST